MEQIRTIPNKHAKQFKLNKTISKNMENIRTISCNKHGEHFQFYYKYMQVYRVYKKKRNLGISQEIDIVLKTKDFRRLGI
jgi:hypothetical protein